MVNHVWFVICVCLLLNSSLTTAQSAAEPITTHNVTDIASLGYYAPQSEETIQRLNWLPGSEDIFVVYSIYAAQWGYMTRVISTPTLISRRVKPLSVEMETSTSCVPCACNGLKWSDLELSQAH